MGHRQFISPNLQFISPNLFTYSTIAVKYDISRGLMTPNLVNKWLREITGTLVLRVNKFYYYSCW